MARLARTLATIGYFVCWIATGAVVTFFAAALLFGVVTEHVVSLRAVDDDWTLFMLPVGALAGALVAARTRRVRWLHLCCLPFGGLVLIASLVEAGAQLTRANAARGTGPFAGLAEVLAAGLFVVIAGTGLLIVGIGVCGTTLRRVAG